MVHVRGLASFQNLETDYFMGKKVAILQSNYIPWKGYFNIIQYVDEFILLDNVQFTRRDWRNRNLIKAKSGTKWLTIPVDVKGKFTINIHEVRAVNNDWRIDHWNQIRDAYKSAAYFKEYETPLKELYLDDSELGLSMINFKFITTINSFLNIQTPIRWSMDFDTPAEKNERLLHICKDVNADIYVSGSSAKSYLNEDLFKANHIEVDWVDYSNYPVYRQLFPPFIHGVSVLDLLFNEGPHSKDYLKERL